MLAWDQSEKFVKLYLTGLAGLGGCSNEKIVISYTRFVIIRGVRSFSDSFSCSESVSVRIGPLSEQQPKIFTFNIKKTCHKINPEKSYHKVVVSHTLDPPNASDQHAGQVRLPAGVPG